jgi:hypothetical protein
VQCNIGLSTTTEMSTSIVGDTTLPLEIRMHPLPKAIAHNIRKACFFHTPDFTNKLLFMNKARGGRI